MCLILFEVIDGDEVVSIAGLLTVCTEELFRDLRVLHIGSLTLLIHVHCIVKRGEEAERGEKPLHVFVEIHPVCLGCLLGQVFLNRINLGQREEVVKF